MTASCVITTLILSQFWTLQDLSCGTRWILIAAEMLSYPQTGSLLSNLSDKAYIPANEGFAVGSANYSASGKSYGLVQCWRDISVQDCRKCLVTARANLSKCCAKNEGAQYLSRSCKVRYEIYPFFETALAPSPSPEGSNSTPKKKSSKIVPIILGFMAGIILVLVVCLIVMRKKVRSAILGKPVTSAAVTKETQRYSPISGLMEDKSFVYNIEVLAEATDNFHVNNKLGEGGFGLVYKGTTRDGTQIAVKKISANSVEGKKNFMNEVKLVANVQHRNLARLLGCCIEGDERFLVYEYFPNKSLDTYIFDQEKRRELDWQRRYNIIIGIARGLLYLHQESQLQIIHRDIKANNILLDHKLDPKIADFGLAKLFPEDKTHIHTRVAGTCGYIAPEYAMQGQLSVKVDVYSFGVVLLEIVSGRKNNDNQLPYDMQHLVEWAWKLFHEGKALNMVDSEASGVNHEQALRCIHVGLLCVQANATLRPVMSDAITTLSSSSVTLPNPLKPAFVSTSENQALKPESKSQDSATTTSSVLGIPSVYEASVTKVEAR